MGFIIKGEFTKKKKMKKLSKNKNIYIYSSSLSNSTRNSSAKIIIIITSNYLINLRESCIIIVDYTFKSQYSSSKSVFFFSMKIAKWNTGQARL